MWEEAATFARCHIPHSDMSLFFSHMLQSVSRRATRTHLAERTFKSMQFFFPLLLVILQIRMLKVCLKSVNQMQQNSFVSSCFHSDCRQRLNHSHTFICPSSSVIFSLLRTIFSEFKHPFSVTLMENGLHCYYPEI